MLGEQQQIGISPKQLLRDAEVPLRDMHHERKTQEVGYHARALSGMVFWGSRQGSRFEGIPRTVDTRFQVFHWEGPSVRWIGPSFPYSVSWTLLTRSGTCFHTASICFRIRCRYYLVLFSLKDLGNSSIRLRWTGRMTPDVNGKAFFTKEALWRGNDLHLTRSINSKTHILLLEFTA
jgi:hypothetical protein